MCPIVLLIKFCYEQALLVQRHIVEFYFVLGCSVNIVTWDVYQLQCS